MNDEEVLDDGPIQIDEREILTMTDVQILNSMHNGRVALSSYCHLNNEIIRRLVNAQND